MNRTLLGKPLDRSRRGRSIDRAERLRVPDGPKAQSVRMQVAC